MPRLRYLVCPVCCFVCLLLLSPLLEPLKRALLGPHPASSRLGVSEEAFSVACPVPIAQREYFHWPRLPVRVFIAAESGREKQYARIAEAGFDEWAEATDGAVGYRLVGTPGQAQIRVRFTPGATVPEHPDLVGITTTYWTGPVLESAEIVLAADRKTPDDLQTVAAHEFGHALGIRGHSGDPGDLMFPSLIKRLPSVRLPSVGASPPGLLVTKHDLENLKRCYPALLAGQAAWPEEQRYAR